MVLTILFISLNCHYSQKLCGQGSISVMALKSEQHLLVSTEHNWCDSWYNSKRKTNLWYVCEVIISCIHLWYFFNPHIQSLFITLLCFVSHSRKCFQHMLISSQVVVSAFYFSSSVLQKKYQHRVLMFLLSQGKLFELLLI